jgi:methylenetetrahydrofolate dehydrogenase (NADP+)/methenyltetrahydrofolate cyclohydrolase
MPKRLLDGSELAGFIKERQAKSVRGLKQARAVAPKLAIIQTKDDAVINTYVELKKRYGADIGVGVESYFIEQAHVAKKLQELNQDRSVHGIIAQLPLSDPNQTDEICNLVDPKKDVDALGENSTFDPATPAAILWLLSGYNIDLNGKNILLIGRGKLVGAPLEKILKSAGHKVTVAERETEDLKELTLEADVIITAAGSPALLFSDMIKTGVVVVDAGVASEDGRTVGDVSDEVYKRDDIILTPKKGGVGPLTVCALFENVITATRRSWGDD